MFRVPPAGGCAQESRAGHFTQDLAEMRKVTKSRNWRQCPTWYWGITSPGGRCHISHPSLSQMKALRPVFKQDQVSGSFFNTKTSSCRKRNRERLYSSLWRSEQGGHHSPNHPSLEEHHKFIPIYIDTMRATRCQINAAEESFSWATWVRLPRMAHQTHTLLAMESICSDGKRCFYDTTFFWHAAQELNNNTRSGGYFSVVYKTRREKPQLQRNLWLIQYIQKRKSHKNLCIHDKVYI